MKRGFSIAMVFAGCLLAPAGLVAQDAAGGGAAGSAQNKPASDTQKPAAAPAQPAGNPFPEDTTSIPVMPNAATPAEAPADLQFRDSGNLRVPLPARDTDPVRSPDDPQGGAASDQPEDDSSSLKGMENLLPKPDEDVNRKPRKKEPTHQEAASTDIDVGKYYLERKDWKAAHSRFESAMVLDPENPEVYWGLAEAEHHLGNFASARAYYMKLLDYDPDGPHGKAARKAMKEPEIANAQNAAKGPAAPEPPK